MEHGGPKRLIPNHGDVSEHRGLRTSVDVAESSAAAANFIVPDFA
jgi:hypothetical protein